MHLYYEGVDMARIVNITKCTHRDVSRGRVDCLEVEFDHAAAWHRWEPQIDDVIEAERDGYTTGKLYLNTILPKGDRYQIWATSVPRAAQFRAWVPHANMTLAEIARRCGAECGLDAQLYGIDGNIRYPFILRKYEGCAAFLDRLGKWEGLAVKAYNGAFRAIAVDWVQQKAALKTLRITTSQEGVEYTDRRNTKYGTLTVSTPYAEATARDSGAPEAPACTMTAIPALNAVEAGRWARGLLLEHNRQAEALTVKSTFDPLMTALIRLDVEGDTAARGEWLTDEVEQDLHNGQTTVKMLRVISTIQ